MNLTTPQIIHLHVMAVSDSEGTRTKAGHMRIDAKPLRDPRHYKDEADVDVT